VLEPHQARPLRDRRGQGRPDLRPALGPPSRLPDETGWGGPYTRADGRSWIARSRAKYGFFCSSHDSGTALPSFGLWPSAWARRAGLAVERRTHVSVPSRARTGPSCCSESGLPSDLAAFRAATSDETAHPHPKRAGPRRLPSRTVGVVGECRTGRHTRLLRLRLVVPKGD
jgi:hypothetical protein